MNTNTIIKLLLEKYKSVVFVFNPKGYYKCIVDKSFICSGETVNESAMDAYKRLLNNVK